MTGTRADERGIAVITAILVATVVFLLSATAVALSLHNQDASGMDRNRVTSVHGAEAGIDTVVAAMQSSVTATLPCSTTGSTTVTPKATYSVAITYYPTWPPSGAPLTCSPVYGLLSAPQGAVLESRSTTGRVTRTMESAVRLSPVYNGFSKAIFSDGTPSIANNVKVYGTLGGPADVYTNGSWNCANGVLVDGSVYAQGGASIGNSCTVNRDLWVANDVSMPNAGLVGNNLTSSRGSITLGAAATVVNRVTAAGTCTGCSTAHVNQTLVATNQSGLPLPPAITFPQLTYDEASWTAAGYAIVPFTDCTLARNFIVSGRTAGVRYVVRILSSCTLSFTNNTNVSLSNNLAIITDGSIEFLNKGTWSATSGAEYDLHFIVPYGTSCTSPTNNGHISKSNNTDFADLRYFVYTPCTVTFENNNDSSVGQVYGGTISLSNLMRLYFQPVGVPGFGNTVVTGYGAQPAYIREVAN